MPDLHRDNLLKLSALSRVRAYSFLGVFSLLCYTGGCSHSSGSAGSDGSSTQGDGGAGNQDGAAGQGHDLGSQGALPLAASQAQGLYFPSSAPWYQDVSAAAVAADSATITSFMMSNLSPNGWGGGTMQVDFSIAAMNAGPSTVKRTYTIDTPDYFPPDCDDAPVPVPQGGMVEATYGTPTMFTSPFSGYNCAGFSKGDDCHMLFVARAENRLYEIWRSTIDSSNKFTAGGRAICPLTLASQQGRGQDCDSADAAGFSIAALLFSPDEIQAGHIDHAIRFILPQSAIRGDKSYVPPATHWASTSGPAAAGPYGMRMRLHANYPLNTLSPAAQVVAKALQKYGMLLADAGTVALTASSDLVSSVKWTDVGFDANSLSALKASDFDVIAYPTPTIWGGNCNRTQITN